MSRRWRSYRADYRCEKPNAAFRISCERDMCQRVYPMSSGGIRAPGDVLASPPQCAPRPEYFYFALLAFGGGILV